MVREVESGALPPWKFLSKADRFTSPEVLFRPAEILPVQRGRVVRGRSHQIGDVSSRLCLFADLPCLLCWLRMHFSLRLLDNLLWLRVGNLLLEHGDVVHRAAEVLGIHGSSQRWVILGIVQSDLATTTTAAFSKRLAELGAMKSHQCLAATELGSDGFVRLAPVGVGQLVEFELAATDFDGAGGMDAALLANGGLGAAELVSDELVGLRFPWLLFPVYFECFIHCRLVCCVGFYLGLSDHFGQYKI